MYSTEQRRVAIETFIRFDHSYADTIAELGYPDRHTLRNWWGEYRETGEVPIAKIIREPRFSDEQKREAVEHYLNSCRLNPAFVHRGNLDPEISALIKAYGLNKE